MSVVCCVVLLCVVVCEGSVCKEGKQTIARATAAGVCAARPTCCSPLTLTGGIRASRRCSAEAARVVQRAQEWGLAAWRAPHPFSEVWCLLCARFVAAGTRCRSNPEANWLALRGCLRLFEAGPPQKPGPKERAQRMHTAAAPLKQQRKRARPPLTAWRSRELPTQSAHA